MFRPIHLTPSTTLRATGSVALMAALLLAQLLAGPSAIVATQSSPSAPAQTALDSLADIENLPSLTSEYQVRQVSSRDFTDGNFDGAGGHVTQRDGRYVLLDEAGPGVISRIWMTWPREVSDAEKGDIDFTFDGEATPRLRLPLAELFQGQTDPFRSPLAGNADVSSGGYFAYLPIPFERSIRISLSRAPVYWQITYQIRRADRAIASFTGQESSQAARDLWTRAGADPKPQAGNQVVSGTLALAAGGSASVVELDGSGEIRQLALTVHPSMLDRVWLTVRWEGEAAPAIEAPLADFFGAGIGSPSVRSLVIGRSPNGDLYCHFPMPFHRSARIALESRGAPDLAVPYLVAYRLGPAMPSLPEGIGHLRAQFRDEAPNPAELDFTAFEATGRGKFVGLALAMYGRPDENYPGFLEGDDWIYVDGDRSLSLGGTGLEDYFNSGYYFQSNVASTLQLHGAPTAYYDPSGFYYSAYRFHILDAIPFQESMRFGIEYFPWAVLPARYRSLAFWYGRPEPSLRQTDALTPSDPASLMAHQAVLTGTVRTADVTSSYGARRQREQDTFAVTYLSEGTIEFTAALYPANRGARLERTVDWEAPDQTARVFVDGEPAGTWRTAGANPIRRWTDDRFEIPPGLVAGKSSVRIRIEPVTVFSTAAYRVHSQMIGVAPTPTVTRTPTVTATPTVTPSPTGTATPTATPTSTPTATPSATTSASPTSERHLSYLPIIARGGEPGW